MYFFVSICYYRNYLVRNIHEECSFRASLFLKDIPSDFVSISWVTYSWNETKEVPELTGVPIHVLLMAEIDALWVKFNLIQVTKKHNINTALNERGIDGSNFYKNNILNVIDR